MDVEAAGLLLEEHPAMAQMSPPANSQRRKWVI
jgi:hypothetical protein